MIFFSGFCLKGEEGIFEAYHDSSNFCVSGFSLGAIEAFEYVCETKRRVDKLQLFSPAFFQDKDEKFRRLQEIHYKKDKALYIKNFLENIAYPTSVDMQRYYHDSGDLHKLLTYQWSKDALQRVRDKSIMIEVYLGKEDKIIDVQKAKAFFQEFATVIMIANSGHILKEKNG